MNNEDKILALLEQVISEQADMKSMQNKINSDMADMKSMQSKISSDMADMQKNLLPKVNSMYEWISEQRSQTLRLDNMEGRVDRLEDDVFALKQQA